MTDQMTDFKASEVHRVTYEVQVTFNPPIEVTKQFGPLRGGIPRRYALIGATYRTTVDARGSVTRVTAKLKAWNLLKDGSYGASSERFKYGLTHVLVSDEDQARLDRAQNESLDWVQDAHRQWQVKEGLA